MTSRRTRQGLLGLFLLVTASLTAGVLFWLKGSTFGQPTFEITATFPDATGLNEGSPVRFRGSQVGQVVQITPQAEGVQIRIRITQPHLAIPANSNFAINQSSFLGASTLDITPPVNTIATRTKPLDKNCDRSVILCNNSSVRGEQGVSTEALLRASMDFTKAYSDPDFVKNLATLTKSANLTSQELAKTSKEYALLAQTARQELRQLSAVSTTTAQNFSTTAQSFTRTSDNANLTLAEINSLLTENRTTLVSTLDNLSQTSQTLKVALTKMGPSIDRLTSGPILQNLEVLSSNAAITSANLRDASKALNDPATLTQLQQTLDAARATFQNTQKLTTDMDDLIGDPKLRENLRQLINGLSNLVSDANQLQRQTQIARAIPPTPVPPIQTPMSAPIPVPVLSPSP